VVASWCEELDKLIMILKNWPSNAKCGCPLANKGVEDFFVVEYAMLKNMKMSFKRMVFLGLMCNDLMLFLEKEKHGNARQQMWNLANYFLGLDCY
jgi:hypothetical protein